MRRSVHQEWRGDEMSRAEQSTPRWSWSRAAAEMRWVVRILEFCKKARTRAHGNNKLIRQADMQDRETTEMHSEWLENNHQVWWGKCCPLRTSCANIFFVLYVFVLYVWSRMMLAGKWGPRRVSNLGLSSKLSRFMNSINSYPKFRWKKIKYLTLWCSNFTN